MSAGRGDQASDSPPWTFGYKSELKEKGIYLKLTPAIESGRILNTVTTPGRPVNVFPK
jgi:hypothetical protein